MKQSGRIVWLFILFSLLPAQVFAQAYCALRDPASHIQQLYPDSNQFRSIVKTVDESARDYVAENMPPNALHFGELGRHTLYVALRDKEVLGLVHVRSEESRWGLVEIAWSMDLGLKVQDYSFQRCRSRVRKVMEANSVKDQFRGKTFSEMRVFLAEDGRSANRDTLNVPDNAAELAAVVVRNGLKTLLVTRQVWAMEIEALQMLKNAQRAFPDAQQIQLAEQTPISPAVTVALKSAFGDASIGTNRAQIKLARVLDAQAQPLGVIYRGIHTINGKPLTLWWAIRPDLTIETINADSPWPSGQVESVFKELTGKTFADSKNCGNRAELMALEAIITARPLLNNNQPRHTM